jgi:hypothetical protein
MVQSCREKNPRTSRERVAEWDACHRLGRTEEPWHI